MEVLKVIVQDTDDLPSSSSSSSLFCPKKIFCSQSVVLMLRHCLDAAGKHGNLVEKLACFNSRLTSPKMVFSLLETYEAAYRIDNEGLYLLGRCLQPKECAK